jgi:hypothetical protein
MSIWKKPYTFVAVRDFGSQMDILGVGKDLDAAKRAVSLENGEAAEWDWLETVPDHWVAKVDSDTLFTNSDFMIIKVPYWG